MNSLHQAIRLTAVLLLLLSLGACGGGSASDRDADGTLELRVLLNPGVLPEAVHVTVEGTAVVLPAQTATTPFVVSMPFAAARSVQINVRNDASFQRCLPATTTLTIESAKTTQLTVDCRSRFSRIELVKDINTQGFDNGSSPSGLFAHRFATGELLLFSAYTPQTGIELYAFDPLTRQARLVRDIRPGPAAGGAYGFLAYDDGVVFLASEDGVNTDIWKTDGTTEGTRRLFGLTSGAVLRPVSMLVSGGNLYVVTQQDALLRVNDSSILALLGGLVFPTVPDVRVVAVPGGVAFDTPRTRQILGVSFSDGTTAGTRRIVGSSGETARGDLLACGGRLFVNGSVESSVSTDAVALVDIERSQITRIHASVSDMRCSNEQLYLFSTSEIAVFDTAGGAVRVLLSGLTAPHFVHFAAGGFYFLMTAPGASSSTLWWSDGTPAGTRDLRVTPVFDQGPRMRALGEASYFLAQSTDGVALMRAIGPRVDTILAADPGFQAPLSSALAGRLYFAADDALHATELWSTDGTAAGTELAADIAPQTRNADATINILGAVNGRLVFTEAASLALWASDGTSAGTTALAAIPRLPGREFVAETQGFMFFFGSTPAHGIEPWRTDGTAAGTFEIADLNPGSTSSFASESIAVVQAGVIFTANTVENGAEPWITDGSAIGTRILVDLAPGAASSLADSFIDYRGGYLFRSTQGVSTLVDGTLGNVYQGNLPSYAFDKGTIGDVVRSLQPLDDGAVFMTNGPCALWQLANGQLTQISGPPETQCSWPFFVTAKGAVFIGGDAEHGIEYRSVTAATAPSQLLNDMNPGVAGFRNGYVGGNGWRAGSSTLGFSPFVGTGYGAWVTDGTPAGTTKLRDASTGTLLDQALYTDFQFPADDVVVFAGPQDGDGTRRLWIADRDGSHVMPLTTTLKLENSTRSAVRMVGTTLFFVANDDVHGFELWKATLDAAP